MAEVIGIVSGAITFATVVVQITNSIITIKECWSQIRDAPDDLKYLVREIEAFGLILADIEETLSQESASAALRKSKQAMQSIAFCKKAAADLQTIAEDMLKTLRPSGGFRRSYAAMKITLQKGKLEKYRSRLQNAVRLLQLSQQCYTMFVSSRCFLYRHLANDYSAFMQIQPELIAEKIMDREKIEPKRIAIHRHLSIALMRLIRSLEMHANISERGLSRLPTSKSRRKSNINLLWRLSLPFWITSRVLELTGLRVPGGWTWKIRTFNVIPASLEFLEIIESGDIRYLQELFTSGQASPLDQISHSGGQWTWIEVS